jgi:hypothetical protein
MLTTGCDMQILSLMKLADILRRIPRMNIPKCLGFLSLFKGVKIGMQRAM